MQISNVTNIFNTYVLNKKKSIIKESTRKWITKEHSQIFKTDTNLILVYISSTRTIPKYIINELALCFKVNTKNIKNISLYYKIQYEDNKETDIMSLRYIGTYRMYVQTKGYVPIKILHRASADEVLHMISERGIE